MKKVIKGTRLGVRMTTAEKIYLQEVCEKNNCTMSEYILKLIEQDR